MTSPRYDVYLDLDSGSRLVVDGRTDRSDAERCAGEWANEIKDNPDSTSTGLSGAIAFHRHVSAVGVDDPDEPIFRKYI